MSDALISLVSGVAGGLIVAVGTILTSLLKAHNERNRELLQQACNTALADFSADTKNAEPTEHILPLSTYIYFHFHFFKLLESDKISEERILQLKAQDEKLSNILEGSIWRDYVTKNNKKIML